MKLVLRTANIVGDEKNCLYPNRAEVSCAEELQEAVKMDHVCAEYDNDYRSKENFRQSNASLWTATTTTQKIRQSGSRRKSWMK